MGKLKELSGAQKRKKRKIQREKQTAINSKIPKISSLFPVTAETTSNECVELESEPLVPTSSKESQEISSSGSSVQQEQGCHQLFITAFLSFYVFDTYYVLHF